MEIDALKYNPTVTDPLPFASEEVMSLAPATTNKGVSEMTPVTTQGATSSSEDKVVGITDYSQQEETPKKPGAKPFTFFYRNNDAYQYTQLTNWELYPTQTHVHCWWDSHSFQNAPVGLPVKRDDKNHIYHCIGCFCSANCAMAYARQSKMSTVLLNQMYNESENVVELTAAPHFSMLACFGGSLDITEFRNKSHSQWKDYHAPMVPWAVISEERVKNSIIKPNPATNKEKISKLRSITRT